MTSSQKPVDDIICSGVTPFLLFSQYGILYAEHQNIFPFRKLLFYSAQYFPVSEAKPHKPQLHFGSHRGAVCGLCGQNHSCGMKYPPGREDDYINPLTHAGILFLIPLLPSNYAPYFSNALRITSSQLNSIFIV